MSRVAKNPITVPKGVEITLGELIAVKGPLGHLTQRASQDVEVSINDGVLSFAPTNTSIQANAMSGTMRALLNNMVQGVTKGFEKKLNLVGVGYRAQAQGDVLNLTLGFSHPVTHKMPQGIKCETPTQTEIVIKGIDRQVVGQVAADVRSYRPPEPYKGKGVRYSDEVVIKKETKKN
jgi:large subunit ribosomal protein L6